MCDEAPYDRRTVLLTVGAAAVAAVTGAGRRAIDDIRGAVTFEGSAAIPEGHLEIYLDDPAIQDETRRSHHANAHQKRRKIEVDSISLPSPASATASSTRRIVARLERADGWLIARGTHG